MRKLRPIAISLLGLCPLVAAAQGPPGRPALASRTAHAVHLRPATQHTQATRRAVPFAGPPIEEVPPSAREPFAPARSEEPIPALTLADAQAIALANNPTIAQAAARVQGAHGAWLQAGLVPNPQIGYLATEVGNEGRAGQQGGFISQEFVTGRKLGLSREVAARDIALAEQRLAAQRLRVANDVRIAFYDALLSQRRAEVAAELVKIADGGIRAAEGLRKAKEASTADVLRAQIESQAAGIELARAQYQQQAAWQTLAARMGLPPGAANCGPRPALVGAADAPACDYCWDAALERLLYESPEMAAAAVRVERARWALSRAQAEPIPNVTLEGSVQHDSATRDVIGGFQASIPIPVFNRNQGNILTAPARCTPPSGTWIAWPCRFNSGWPRSTRSMPRPAARRKGTKARSWIRPSARST